MFHWTERTGYRVIRIQPFERAAVYALFASLLLSAAPLVPMLMIGFAGMPTGPIFVSLGIAIVASMTLLFYWWTHTCRIEIPTRPGPVRWSNRHGLEGVTPPVRRFEASAVRTGLASFRYGIVVITVAGERVPVLPGWYTWSREEIEGIVCSMNAEMQATDWDASEQP